METDRINLIGQYLKKEFGGKTVKLSLDGGFTCPNRDGTLGYGGCSFCSERGSGDNASSIDRQIELLSKKWKNIDAYIAYFQNYTGTYDSVDNLRKIYYSALSNPNIKGLAIATRPDCLSDEIIELLKELNEETYFWIELGLQTTNDLVATSFGRGYKTEVYYEAVNRLKEANIKTVTHILLGLPGEGKDEMETTVREVCNQDIWGIKFHLLNLVRGTRLAIENPDYISFESPEEYVELICNLLEIVPRDVVVHRLAADSPKEILISPKWAYRKRLLLDMIYDEMKRRNSYQGINVDISR